MLLGGLALADHGGDVREVFYAALASLGFGVFFNLRGRKLFAAAAGGGIGWLFYTLAAAQGPMMQNFIASLSITAYAEIMARTQRAPVPVYLTPALIPLVPGGPIYQAMLHALNGETDLFLSTGLLAMSVTGAIALGVVAASSAMRLIFLRHLARPSR